MMDGNKTLLRMIKYDDTGYVPADLCTIDRDGGADDFIGCGYCFKGNNEADCNSCIVTKIFNDYAKLTRQIKSEE